MKKSRFISLGRDEWKKHTRTEYTNSGRDGLGTIIKNGSTFTLWCDNDVYGIDIPTLEDAKDLAHEIRWIRYNYVIKAKKLCAKMMEKYGKVK